MKMEQTGCSEKSTYKIQTPGNYPEEGVQNSKHGEIFKSRILPRLFINFLSNLTDISATFT